MARNSSASGKAAIEKKALAMDNKSEGMRLLFDAGYTVVQVREVFDAPYGYVYGVALRHGVVETAASRRAPAKAKAKAAKTTSRSARPAQTSKGTTKTSRAKTAPAAKRTARATAKPAAPAKRATATKQSAASRVAARIAARKG